MRLPIVGGPLPIFHGMPHPTRNFKKKQQKGKNENNNKKIMRSLQNTTKRTRTNARRKLKEEVDLNDKLTSTQLVAQWPQKITKEHKGSQRK